MYAFLFCVICILLFLSARLLTKSLSAGLLSLTHSGKWAVRVLAFLFLPGVVVHELAHALAAYALFVPVGKMEFVPTIHETHVKLGSVQIGKTDPVRRFVIGVAPVLVGMSLLLAVCYYLLPPVFTMSLFTTWQFYTLVYVSFQISNTMFSSRRDMEGALELIVVLLLVVVILYFFGIKIPQQILQFIAAERFEAFFRQISLLLCIPLALNVGIWMLLRTSIGRTR